LQSKDGFPDVRDHGYKIDDNSPRQGRSSLNGREGIQARPTVVDDVDHQLHTQLIASPTSAGPRSRGSYPGQPWPNPTNPSEFVGHPTSTEIKESHDASSEEKGAETPLVVLNRLASEFRGKWLAACAEFLSSPDHRSQEARTKCRTWTDALLQEIILKANSVETGGDQTAQTMRSSLVEEVSRICKSLDAAVSDDLTDQAQDGVPGPVQQPQHGPDEDGGNQTEHSHLRGAEGRTSSGRNTPNGADYIGGLESRLGRLESLLKLSGLMAENETESRDSLNVEGRLANRTTSDPTDDHTNSDEATSRDTSSRKDSSTAKGAKYLDALENRLRHMESLPKTSGLLSDEGGVEADRNTLEQWLADKGESSNATGSGRSLSEKKQRPDPLIYKLVPAAGSITGGTEVTLLGNHFYQGLEVMFGDTEATVTTFWSDKCLNCVAPPALQTGAVEILFKHEHPLHFSNRARSRATPVVFMYFYDRIPQLQKLREHGSIPWSFHLEPESVERNPPVAKQ
jgi:hypothetical protein